MNFSFYGYTVRSTTEEDLPLAFEWTAMATQHPLSERLSEFWLKQGDGRQSFLVIKTACCKCGHRNIADHYLTSQDEEGELWCMKCLCREYREEPDLPLAFFQKERVNPSQTRLHFQASPVASPKKILRGITLLVPLIEKGLALGGVKHIFFTSHSLSMVAFMEKRLGYRLSQNTDGGADGVVIFKEIQYPPSKTDWVKGWTERDFPAESPADCIGPSRQKQGAQDDKARS